MPAAARSLAEDLRMRTDDQLARLFALRPGLLRPVPKSFADLALRANSAPANVTALDDLTRAELDSLEACCALSVVGRFGVGDVAQGLDSDEATVAPIVRSLYERVLLWGSEQDLRVPSAVREAFGREPCGLDATPRGDQPAIRATVADPARLLAELADAPEEAGRAAYAAAWGPPTLPEPALDEEADGLDWLVARGLLVRDELGNRVLPREIALVLRRGLLVRDAVLDPPVRVDALAAGGADGRAGHAADQFVRDTDRVVTEVARRPWTRQASGGIGARDWDRATSQLGIGAQRLGLIVAVAWEAGWLDADADHRIRPTTSYAEAADLPVASRWAALAETWLTLPRPVPPDATRVLAVRDDSAVTAARRLVLEGLVAGAGADLPRWLRWYRPRSHLSDDLLAGLVAAAEALGFAAGGTATTLAHALTWPPDPVQLAGAVAPLLPAVTDRVVLQADLTATALAPLEPAVERRLGIVADWESGGGASVFRFSADSIRRGLAAGQDPDELLDWLARTSLTEVPQALAVLVADQAGAASEVTVHPAHTVLRCDPQVGARILADVGLRDLGLHAVAPGVVVSPAAPSAVAARLREHGHTVAEAGGDLVAADRRPSRRPASGGPTAVRVVESLRHVEEHTPTDGHPPADLAATGPHGLHQRLHDAAARHGRLWLAFADESGTRLTHLVEPLALEAGDVCAFDVTAGEIRTIPLERIVGSAPVQR